MLFLGTMTKLARFLAWRLNLPPNLERSYSPFCFESDWANPDTGRKLPLYPHVVIVPVYNKIRLTFLDVLAWLTRMTEVLKLVISSPLEWDVYLTLSNEYKKLLRDERALDDNRLESILLMQHPRFIWRALLVVGGVRVADVAV